MSSINVIPQLEWQRKGLGGVLTRFVAQINNSERFIISWDADQPDGYQWELRIVRKFWGPAPATSVLLHRHPTLEDAKKAAARHVGDE